MPLLAFSEAFLFTAGLIVTFIGIGILVNILLGYAALQIHAERQQNRALEEERVTG